MSSRRRGNRGGAFPGRGRGAKYVSTTNSESSVTLNLNVQVSSATHATEVQHGNVNVNRGRGSRGRRGFQPHVGSDRGKAHAKSKGSFQPPKHSSVPCKDGGSVMVQQRRETNQDNSKQASKTVNTSACHFVSLRKNLQLEKLPHLTEVGKEEGKVTLIKVILDKWITQLKVVVRAVNEVQPGRWMI
ncbi:hypothetical protein HOLleu_16971 [Holothuria leucospilota]|uniref:Uncharacterized protein n=1 Tax=Holothuria leucospilota TaxID=206669 RepID=A0A9Q1HBL9_HOLLE|nr:hypothetical protein HOLleu_16971 [Holothuria leucospilota]